MEETVLPNPGQKRPLRELSGGIDDNERDRSNLAIENEVISPSGRLKVESDTGASDGVVVPTSFQRLRLEAIFFPKFENEKLHQIQQVKPTKGNGKQSDSLDLREKMKQKIQQKQGYLEVTLKHSGSLLLWSGGSRYYSKNSTDNVFTMVGEIVLRQHFYRAWYNENDDVSDDNTTFSQGESMYQACSDYLEQHRLTLAMELVTSVLGDHGAVPKRDYVIVTALARRSYYDDQRHGNDSDDLLSQQPLSSWFATTPELLTFCQRLRLPHNDVWMLTSMSTVNGVLDAYDTWREKGLASTVIPALTAVSDVHIASMYPHEIFQGDILEGLVVRYVPYSQQQQPASSVDCGNENEPVELIEKMLHLVKDAEDIRKRWVPAHRPPSFQLPLLKTNRSALIGSIDLRAVFDQCKGKLPDGLTRLENALKSILLQQSIDDDAMTDDNDDDDSKNRNSMTLTRRRHVERVSKRLSSDFPTWVKPLMESSNDETRQIARLINKLQGLSGRVDYHVWREVNPGPSPAPSPLPRWLCMIHVVHDTTFAKYRRKMRKGDMELFRGFCVEFGNWGDESEQDQQVCAHESNSMPSSPDDSEVEDDDDDYDDDHSNGALMLKMKLLPYMVRTFACRNGIPVIQKSGPSIFLIFCVGLLKKWQVSDEAKQKWMPFFQAWGCYAKDCLGNASDNTSSSPISKNYYLDHLERFSELYEAGVLVSSISSDSGFRGVVVVVALDLEKADVVAQYVANELGGLRVVNDIKKDDFLMAKALGYGFVYSTTVVNGLGKVKQSLKEYSSYISVLLYACSETNIVKLSVAEDELKGINGKLRSWRDLKPSQLIELDESSLSIVSGDEFTCSASDDFRNLIVQLRITANSLPEVDARPGIVVFFPGIPGCGKSTLCNAGTRSKLKFKLSQMISTNASDGVVRDSPKARNVVVRSGDAVKKKYWDLVKDERLKDVSCVYIADKNSPPTWEKVGEVCASSKGVAIPVIFDEGVMQTTEITGMRRHDGTLAPNARHMYPFSLHFLAVCMARVLDRQEMSHQGKLDRGTQHACWIVLQFFSFYRMITAETFLGTLEFELKSKGALTVPLPINLSFFRDKCPPPLPCDLEELLIEALQIQFGRNNKKVKSDDEEVNALEARLRATLNKYRDHLLAMTVDVNASQEEFVAQVVSAVEEVDSLSSLNSPSLIKLVSIDLQRDQVIAIVNANVDKLSSFMEQLKPHQAAAGDPDPDILFVSNPHVTLCHRSDINQSSIHEAYDHLCGKSVEVEITGLLWSEHIATLAAVVPNSTTDGCSLPLTTKDFPHVTLWHLKEVAPFLSNDLPALLGAGQAGRVVFDHPTVLRGKISFWGIDKH